MFKLNPSEFTIILELEDESGLILKSKTNNKFYYLDKKTHHLSFIHQNLVCFLCKKQNLKENCIKQCEE